MDELPLRGASLPPSPETRDWSELPVDALSVVFAKLGAVELLMGAGLVCHSWLHAAKLPHLWRCVDMEQQDVVVTPKVSGVVSDWFLDDDDDVQSRYITDRDVLCAMAKVAVDRSDGRLEMFKARDFVDDELLKYIGDRSLNLKSLFFHSCFHVSEKGFIEFIRTYPLLEELVLDYWGSIDKMFKVIKEACPQLKSLELRTDHDPDLDSYYSDEPVHITAMQQLRQLTLEGIYITNEALTAIVDGCPHLELLDISGCFLLDVDDDDALRAKCARITMLKLPDSDSDGDDGSNAYGYYDDSSDHDYYSKCY